MMGLGSTCKITPVFSGRLHLGIHAQFANAATSQGTMSPRWGTGAAPANAAALTGTVVETSIVGISGGIGSNIRTEGIVTGLTPGTQYWFDAGLAASTGTGSISSISCSGAEF